MVGLNNAFLASKHAKDKRWTREDIQVSIAQFQQMRLKANAI